MNALFVTGSGTDIGKTYVTAALVAALRAAGRPIVALKPLASGAPAVDDPAFAASDTGILLRAQGLAIEAAAAQACSPWRFEAPLAPDMAAEAEGRSVSLEEVVDWTAAAIFRAPPSATVLVEGVGGVMSPIARDATVLDWIAAQGAPALLVVASHLGAISHALTAWTALAARHIDVHAILVNESEASTVPLDATAEAVARFAPGARVETLTRGGAITPTLLSRLIPEPALEPAG